jgi:hypothetical protein
VSMGTSVYLPLFLGPVEERSPQAEGVGVYSTPSTQPL